MHSIRSSLVLPTKVKRFVAPIAPSSQWAGQIANRCSCSATHVFSAGACLIKFGNSSKCRDCEEDEESPCCLRYEATQLSPASPRGKQDGTNHKRRVACGNGTFGCGLITIWGLARGTQHASRGKRVQTAVQARELRVAHGTMHRAPCAWTRAGGELTSRSSRSCCWRRDAPDTSMPTCTLHAILF